MSEKNELVEYRDWLKYIKGEIRRTKTQIALSVNAQLHELYWMLGKELALRHSNSKWGSKIIEQLSKDLSAEFPEIKGFSRRNLYAIKQWYSFYSTKYAFVPHHVAQIP
ncbi:DUF1016 N-terminal domain-containing protein [Pontibacter sp. G13]|uniref:DUF1016 N-terminal domain-containing protein n=1 Tax=Pontibacter sp. G13 TaxID=3074898 RepID=UPI00288BF3B8|nr:DUF1016 N-terminal domain-containing protein [Pontibacter sp. G13]WNJ17057.1 DUF1016 N-terminal domain-containing protein [Pontibacter sp. G13]